MEADTASRYRSRILREMNANRNNPFNSPPSSTGSHGTVSPTLSSVFSDPDGESTRRLNDDIARVTASRKAPINWEAAHRKWPEYFSMPKKRDVPIFEDNTDTQLLGSETKENQPPVAAGRFDDEETEDVWTGSARTRAEMQPRVDNESDLSSLVSKPPPRGLAAQTLSKHVRHPSPLAKVQNRVPSAATSHEQEQRRSSLSDALELMRKTSPGGHGRQQEQNRQNGSPHISSARSSLTAVPQSPVSMASPGRDASHVRSFFMPDVSHLGDFVTGTLRFSGSMKNGVPVFVKHGKVHDRREQPAAVSHAEVDGVAIPEDEEKIFVSMDMIRNEIVSLQDHYDKVQEYAQSLQHQVESLESQLKSRNPQAPIFSSGRSDDLMNQNNALEVEVASLKARLEQASRKISLGQIENDSVAQERDRAIKRLQEACDDINKLTRKLGSRDKELETSARQLESTEQMRQDNDTLRRDVVSLRHGRDALELENTSLQTDLENLRHQQTELQREAESLLADNTTLRRDHQSLLSENKSLRASNKKLTTDNEDLRATLARVQEELEAARDEVENLQDEVQTIGEEKAGLQEDNNSLARHNEKYFSENKTLRRDNSGFERSMHDMNEENQKLKDELDFLKQQMDHCRPIPKEDLAARQDEETEENMTSAFFIPDITMNTNESATAAETQTRDMPPPPELTSQSTKNFKVREDTGTQMTQNSTKGNEKRGTHQRSKSMTKPTKPAHQGQKVAFSIPGQPLPQSRSASNIANQGSKRRTSSQIVLPRSTRDFRDEETGTDVFSGVEELTDREATEDLTKDYVSAGLRGRKSVDSDIRELRPLQSNTRTQSHSRSRSRPRSSGKRMGPVETTVESVHRVDQDNCPALSKDARRVLDGLYEHSCQNCIVCSRIVSHRGVVTSSDMAVGKKRVAVSRPVPITDRDITTDDPTMRPSQSPGHALALVIKGLEDEAHHMQLDLSHLQAQYNESDKAIRRRDRTALAKAIHTLLKRLEVKNDQIYSLYDVLEGQKVAGQAMTEEEVEMTVLNITGMTVRDVTAGSEQVTWEGIPDL